MNKLIFVITCLAIGAFVYIAGTAANANKPAFELVENYEAYPDIMVGFYFTKQPGKKELEEMEGILKRHIPTAYVSAITPADGAYSALIDFQVTDYNTGRSQLTQALKDIGGLQAGKKLTKVVID